MMTANDRPSRRVLRARKSRAGVALLALVAFATLVLAAGAARRPAATPRPAFKVVGTWGGAGNAPGQFSSGASGLATDATGNLYVADVDNNRVQVFSAGGELVGGWGTQGIEGGRFYGAEDVAVAPDGRVWVADSGNARVQLFSSTGEPVTAEGTPDGSPGGVAVDADGNLYVAVEGGKLGGVRRYDHIDSGWQPRGGPLIGEGGYRADDVEVSPDGSVYLITSTTQNPLEDRLRRFTADGEPLGSVKLTLGDGTRGVGVDLDCNVWVGDHSQPGDWIVKYSPAGKLLARVPTPYIANDIAVGPTGDLYVKIQNGGIVHYREDRSRPAKAAISGLTVFAVDPPGDWRMHMKFNAAGIACGPGDDPSVIEATASLRGTSLKALRASASVQVEAGKTTEIELRLPDAVMQKVMGTTQKAVFTIVLKTNGRPTTQTARVQFHVPKYCCL